MKVSIISYTVTVLATGAFAVPAILDRDLATIQGILTDVTTQVNNLDALITASPLDPDAVIAQSNTLIQTINDGATTVEAQEALGQIDALGLVTPTQTLSANTNTTIQHLIAIKATLLDGGYGCTTLTALQDQYDGAVALSNAISSKVPDALQSLAESLSAGIADAIQAGIDAYDGACASTSTLPPTTTTTAATTVTTTADTTTITTTTALTPTPSTTTATPTTTTVTPTPTPTSSTTPTKVCTPPASSTPTPSTCPAPVTTTITITATPSCPPEQTITVTKTKTKTIKPRPTWFPWINHGHHGGH